MSVEQLRPERAAFTVVAVAVVFRPMLRTVAAVIVIITDISRCALDQLVELTAIELPATISGLR